MPGATNDGDQFVRWREDTLSIARDKPDVTMITGSIPSSIASSVVSIVNDVGDSGMVFDAQRGDIVDRHDSVLVPSGAIDGIESFVHEAFGTGDRSDAARRAMAQYLIARLTVCMDGPSSGVDVLCGYDLMDAVLADIDSGKSLDLVDMAKYLVSRRGSADVLSISSSPRNELRATDGTYSLELQLDIYDPRYSRIIMMIFLYCAAAMSSSPSFSGERLTSRMLFLLLAPFMRKSEPFVPLHIIPPREVYPSLHIQPATIQHRNLPILIQKASPPAISTTLLPKAQPSTISPPKAPPSTISPPKAPPSTISPTKAPPPAISTLLPKAPPPAISTLLPKAPPPAISTLLPKAPPPAISTLLPKAPPPAISTLLPKAPPPAISTLLPKAPPPAISTLLPKAPPPVISTLLPKAPPPVISTLLPKAPPPIPPKPINVMIERQQGTSELEYLVYSKEGKRNLKDLYKVFLMLDKHIDIDNEYVQNISKATLPGYWHLKAPGVTLKFKKLKKLDVNMYIMNIFQNFSVMIPAIHVHGIRNICFLVNNNEYPCICIEYYCGILLCSFLELDNDNDLRQIINNYLGTCKETYQSIIERRRSRTASQLARTQIRIIDKIKEEKKLQQQTNKAKKTRKKPDDDIREYVLRISNNNFSYIKATTIKTMGDKVKDLHVYKATLGGYVSKLDGVSKYVCADTIIIDIVNELTDINNDEATKQVDNNRRLFMEKPVEFVLKFVPFGVCGAYCTKEKLPQLWQSSKLPDDIPFLLMWNADSEPCGGV